MSAFTCDNNFFQFVDSNFNVGVGWRSIISKRSSVENLQQLCEIKIEHLIRKTTSQGKDPICRSLVSLTEEQQELVEKVSEWVELLPVGVVSDMFNRVLLYDGDDDRKMSPMDVWALMHPGFKQLSIPRREEKNYRPLPNTHKAVLDCLFKMEFLEHLNLSGEYQTIL